MFFVVLFINLHFHNFLSRFTNVVKLDIENENVVSTLFISKLKYTTLFQH